LLAGAGAETTGSRACAACHAAIYKSWSATPMARSSGRAGTDSFERFNRAELTHERSGVRYRALRREGSIELEFSKGEIAGRRRLDFYIGSGAVGRSYAYLSDGFLFQAPVSYYSAPGRWDVSPGFAGRERISLGRPIEPECLSCHATGVKGAPGAQNRYPEEPFTEGGVGCERCHGTGARHVQTGDPADIVQPARLDPERRASICAQCHLTGVARVATQGRSLTSFQPGDRLRDHVVSFVRSGAAEEGFRVNSHFEKLAASGCKKAAGDRFWCGSCHDPHSVPPAAERAAYFRGKCLGCHAESACTVPARARATRKDDCAACHMPRAPVVDVDHAVYTDHSIPRRPREEGPRLRPAATALAPFWGGPPEERELALAYAEAAAIEQNARLAARAFSMLDRLAPRLAGDAPVLEQLGYLYDRRGDARSAALWYGRALTADPARVVAKVNLGGVLARGGQLGAAVERWVNALSRNPGLELPRVYLVQAYRRLGLTEQAREAARTGLQFYPDNPALLDAAK
jgi:hypothetical protein